MGSLCRPTAVVCCDNMTFQVTRGLIGNYVVLLQVQGKLGYPTDKALDDIARQLTIAVSENAICDPVINDDSPIVSLRGWPAVTAEDVEKAIEEARRATET